MENEMLGSRHWFRSSWMWVLNSSIMAGGILRYFCLNGLVSCISMRCLTLCVVPMSVELMENTSENSVIRSLHRSSSFCVTADDSLTLSRMLCLSGFWWSASEAEVMLFRISTGWSSQMWWHSDCPGGNITQLHRYTVTRLEVVQMEGWSDIHICIDSGPPCCLKHSKDSVIRKLLVHTSVYHHSFVRRNNQPLCGRRFFQTDSVSVSL